MTSRRRAPDLEWQTLSSNPVTRAARFGNGWLVQTQPPPLRGSAPTQAPVAMVYVPDAVSGLIHGHAIAVREVLP